MAGSTPEGAAGGRSTTDPEVAARFQREGMAMGALSGHPNVVPVYATGTVDDRPYLVMPLLPDGSLADHLAADGALEPAEVIRLGRGLADALSAAHEAGVLHRDIKPANVLRTPYGALQLADFGIARFADTTQTMGGSLMTTVAYAAPEVLSGEPASAASDIYSLGATLHAALLGRAPYEAGPEEMPLAMAVRVLANDAPDLRSAGIPPALAELVDKAMARDPADRYPSAAALRDALDGVDVHGPAAGGPVPGGDDGPATPRSPRRSPGRPRPHGHRTLAGGGPSHGRNGPCLRGGRHPGGHGGGGDIDRARPSAEPSGGRPTRRDRAARAPPRPLIPSRRRPAPRRKLPARLTPPDTVSRMRRASGGIAPS